MRPRLDVKLIQTVRRLKPRSANDLYRLSVYFIVKFHHKFNALSLQKAQLEDKHTFFRNRFVNVH